MMQNVAQGENEDNNKEIRTVEIEQSTQTGPFPSEKSTVPPTSQSTFGPDISASEDDEVSEVGSFIMDHDIDEDEQDLEPSKFLLPTEGMEASNLPSIDPETHARLEALLEAAGIGKLSTADGKALTDPEVLRKLTSSVSCALDEAAQALHRMRAEQQGQLTTPEGSRSLAEACSDGDVPTVRKLLHEGGSVHETTEEGESLLSLACSAGYYELAQVLLAMKANVEDRGIKGDCTPLMEAASGGYVDIVKLLIAHGADVNAQSSAGNTPLHYAACGGYEDVVQVLIEAGANVEQHNENGHTPLMESASAGHVGVAMILLNSGAGINTHSNEFKESALTLACYKGHLEMVKFLLEAGADQEHKTDEMHTALMEASMDGHVEVARLLLDSGAQVNMPADSFESPLTLAACGGHVELASLLIERGANLEEVNDEGYTPLMEAAREGHEEMVALLLAHEADINAQTEETQETSLTLACCGGFLEVADFLIKAGADIELGCSTPLMEAAQEGHLELVKYLLKSGANVCAQTGTGDTALTYACENGHTDVAEVLLEAGAELEHESEGGRTPLMKAARAGHLCTVQFLISKGAEVNRQTSTNDHTVLSLACAGGHLAVVELMLAHGADPAHKMKDGSTMIIEAAKGGHTQVVKLLLEYPNRVIMNSPDLTQLTDPHLTEARVPVHGLGNIVPPSDPDSTPLSSNGFINIQAGKKLLEKDVTIPNRPADQVWKNMQKSVGKRNHSGGGGNDMSGSKSAKSSESAVPGEQPSQPSPPLLPVSEHSTSLPDIVPDETIDVKASERLEAIINNVMAKELDNTSTREEQILRKQQILQELQKVEKELQLKAQAQLILSAQHQLEQQQQQQHIQALQRKLKKQDGVQPPGSTPSLEDLSLDSPVDTQPPSNDLDKQVSALLASDGSTAVGQIVFPNIPYEGAIVTSSQQPGTTDVVTSENSKENWARNNGNVPKRNSGSNKVTRSNKNTVAPTTSTSTAATVAPLNKNTVTSTTNTTTTTSVAPNTGIVNGTPSVEHNGGSQSQQQPQQAVMGNNATLVAYRQQIQNMAIRQQLAPQPLQLSQQNASAQTIQFPQLQLTPEQQEQLLQMLSQQTFQQQLPQQPLPGQQLPQQHITQQPFVQPLLQQQTLQLIPPQQQQAIQQCAPGQQQYFTQQQQQQLIQQQQQAQLLLQQQMKQPQQNIVTPNVANVQKNPRKQRHLHNNQQPLQPGVVPGNTGMLGIETITPPPSTPLTPNPSPASPQSISPLCAPIDLDAQTESNHDTALTLACHGGHSELVNLLLSKGADIEHRDKKGFTPLILAATAGHVDVVELLLDHGADMEAQSERTKDTPLSLACSGGRYEVVELLLSRGANKEHRNVSDYTPLSLAASGGYVNIIKLLLSHGAEINSRTGSKLGISPLMLAAMNGHTAAVKLLLDMGSDINAQIETNRNTALTLACFQGRHEVVSLLVDRKANIEHRAKTGLTPLMEAASGGYVEVGRVLLDKGADVNAPPVPSSRDTALTIAADKGHYRFVELLLTRGAAVDVKNKKGNSPLWLACNGGHLDVVQLLVSAGADIDSQDNRKVSCLMAAFRKGHIKVVKWMVKNVNQFPSDQELSRYIATITDKELQKKCQQCMEVIVSAKDRQAAEANKNANILLEELDKERQHEENKKAAAAKKREKKKQKKREKQEKEKETTGKSSSPEPECDSIEGNQGSDKNSLVEEDFVNTEPPSATIISTIGITLPTTTESRHGKMSWSKVNNRVDTIVVSSTESKKNKRNKREKERVPDQENMPVPAYSPSPVMSTGSTTTSRNSEVVTRLSEHSNNNNNYNKQSNHNSANTRRRKGNNSLKPTTGIGDLDDFGTLPENLKISDKEVEKLRKNVEKKRVNVDHEGKISNEKLDVVTPSNLNVKTSPVISSPKKGQKKEEGWKEVIRKSKKVQVPSNAISRVIGRGGCNINSIREVSGAHIEVEKQRGTGGERVITIKGSLDATRQANALITALVTDPDKDLLEILPKTKAKVSNKDTMIILGPEVAIPPFGSPVTTGTTPLKSSNTNRSSRNTSSQRDQNLASSTGTVQSTVIWGTTPPPQSVLTSPRRNVSKITPSGGPQGSDKVVTRQLFPGDSKKSGFTIPPQTSTNTTMSYSLASTSAKVSTTSASAYVNKQDNRISSVTSKSQQQQPPPPQTRPLQQPHIQPPVGSIKVLQRPSPSQKFDQPQPLPIISNQQTSTINGPVSSVNGGQPGMVPGMPNQGMFQPFSNMFNINVTDQLMRKDDQAERMNFASVAAAGVVSSMVNPGSPTAELALSMQNLKVDPALQAKAPGFRPPNTKNMSPPGMDPEGSSYKVLQAQMMNDIDASRAPGYRGGLPNHSPAVSPRSNASTASGMSPRGQNPGLDSSQHSTSSVSSQKEEYTTPTQPMTLPKIQSTLNPNAPDFTSRQMGQVNLGGGNPGLTPNTLPFYLQTLYQQALAQQLLQQPGLGMSGGGGSGMVPPGIMSQQDFANLINQFVASGQNQPGSGPNVGGQSANQNAPTFNGLPNVPPRPFSPLQGRPSSAPNMGGGMVKDGSSPGPIGHPNAPSPMSATPPLPEQQLKGDDTKKLRPIGGERAQRRAPGAPLGGVSGGNLADYGPAIWSLASELSMQWNTGSTASLNSVPMSTSTMTSTVTTGGRMSPGIVSDGPVNAVHHNNNEYIDTDEQPINKSMQNTSVQMPFFAKGMVGGGFPQQQQPQPQQQQPFIPGPVGDGMSNLWNPQAKGQVTDPSDKAMWNSWSSQTSM